VDAIHPAPEEWDDAGYSKNDLTNRQLYIDPAACIDCDSCEPVCPTEAIFPEDEVPEKWRSYIDKNYDYFNRDRLD